MLLQRSSIIEQLAKGINSVEPKKLSKFEVLKLAIF